LGEVCRRFGVCFHTDAVQWFGKEPLDSIYQFNADLVSVCGHKFYGPNGSGALFIKSPLLPVPLLFGGSHENSRRAGTENLAAISGFVVALESFVSQPVFDRVLLSPLIDLLSSLNSLDGINLVCPNSFRLSNTCCFTFPGLDSFSLLSALDLCGFCVSSGSACSSGALFPSHVLSAMGLPDSESNSVLRVSIGRETTKEEISLFLSLFPKIIDQVSFS
jgi:cysteine desulfurase